MPSSQAPVPAPASPRRGVWPILLGVFAAGALLAGVVVALILRGGSTTEGPAPVSRREAPETPIATAERVVTPPPVAPAPAPPAARGPISFPISIVHYQSSVENATAATGAADGAFALVRGGVLTLQMPDGQQLVSDGTPAADVEVIVDPARAEAYRVEIGVGHNVFVPVATGVRGSVTVDIDAVGVRIGRFVRISTRATGGTIGVDAVIVRVPGTTAQRERAGARSRRAT